MTRTQRLLELLQILREHRYPVTALTLAEKLGISVRTVYRDIQTLQQQGVCIEGSSGIGYIIKSDYHLPPLTFTPQEINALTLGLNWVCHNTDSDFKKIAKSTLAKIRSVMPDKLKEHIEYQSFLTGPDEKDEAFFAELRHAINYRNKIEITYCDKNDRRSSRVIWPVALVYMEECWLLAGWCELRSDFRHFRTDRIVRISMLADKYNESRVHLLRKWRKQEGLSLDDEY
ncbi:transcriptional regulator [Enterobacter sp. 10-1]|uniref:helix-turn-helix transcriptional regulator n=1 Tax=Raoultella TaxID=160674 RepID=UPI000BA35DBE|nr:MULTISPECIES: YafY family protein [Enterobacteriaceae]MVT02234.1 HTH domain-containing protein [Raoultella sp. 10-1]PAC14739.1 transcriptional regulator [Enterobacter sp. 10-1]